MGPPHSAAARPRRGMTAYICAAALAAAAVAPSARAQEASPPPPPAPPVGQSPAAPDAAPVRAQPVAPPESAPAAPTSAPAPPPADQPRRRRRLRCRCSRSVRSTFSRPAATPASGPTCGRAPRPISPASIIPTLADHPLSPAGAALGRRVLGAAAAAPDGAGADDELAAARARALLALGDAAEAGMILDRTAGVTNSAALSETAAEAALIGDQDDKACAIGDALAVDRGGAYWLKLRAFCQARAGKPARPAHRQPGRPAGRRPDLRPPDRRGHRRRRRSWPRVARQRSRLRHVAAAEARPQRRPRRAPRRRSPPHLASAGRPRRRPPARRRRSRPTCSPACARPRPRAAFAAASRLALPAIVQLVQAKAPLQNPVQLAAAALAAGDLATAKAIRAGLTGDTHPRRRRHRPGHPRRRPRRGGRRRRRPDPRPAGRARRRAPIPRRPSAPRPPRPSCSRSAGRRTARARAAFADFPLGHGDAAPGAAAAARRGRRRRRARRCGAPGALGRRAGRRRRARRPPTAPG